MEKGCSILKYPCKEVHVPFFKRKVYKRDTFSIKNSTNVYKRVRGNGPWDGASTFKTFLFSVLCARYTSDFNYHAIKKKLRHNCAIQGARLIWKQEIWLAICELLCSLSNQNACFITFFCIQLPLFCTVLRKNCNVLNQSESSNFFMYIITVWVKINAM